MGQLSKKVDRTIQKSGLTRKELFLLKPFMREPWSEFTISEIKQMSKNKSHHYVHGALRKFVALDLLDVKMKGNTNTYFINCENGQSVQCLAFSEYLVKETRTDIPYNNLSEITKRISSPFYILVVCGSYAEGKQKPSSDLDVAIIIPASESKKACEMALRHGELMVPEVHGLVFTEAELYLMLVNDEFNYGKELAGKHVITWGAEAYYKILFEAMKHGFKGQHVSETGKDRNRLRSHIARCIKR